MGEQEKTGLSSELDALVCSLRDRHGNAINAILYYGSCMRAGDPFSGIVDLYLIADSYRAFYPGKFRAFLNWALPPNVFYQELAVGDKTLRVKYNVLSLADLHKHLSGRTLQSYFWGRFTQPMRILWSRDSDAKADIEGCLVLAAHTFLERVLPAVEDTGLLSELWVEGLGLSYAAELRTEQSGRSRELVEFDLAHYVGVSMAVAGSLRYPLTIKGSGEEASYHVSVSSPGRFAGRAGWAARRIQGKLLSLARLLKAMFTFDGGLDYAAWKLERHTGQHIEIPDRVRRFPLIFVWGLLWKLYRRGIIR